MLNLGSCSWSDLVCRCLFQYLWSLGLTWSGILIPIIVSRSGQDLALAAWSTSVSISYCRLIIGVSLVVVMELLARLLRLVNCDVTGVGALAPADAVSEHLAAALVVHLPVPGAAGAE